MKKPREKIMLLFQLRRHPLRVQLTALYAGLFVALVAAVLGVSGLLVNHGVQVAPGTSIGSHRLVTIHNFDALPAIVGLIAVLIALWLSWMIAGRFLRPLRTMNATAREISASNLHRRLALAGPEDELSELGRTLDDLFGRLDASFESQRHFVANASHELRTPLAGQRTLLQVALADPDATAEGLRATCEEALQLGEQQERLIDSLLTLATSERGVEQWTPFDLGEVTENVLLSRAHEAERRGIRINARAAAAPALGDPILVESLVSNLVDNALRHNVSGGNVKVATVAAPGRATLSVHNTGPLISSDEVERLFQPLQQIGRERVSHTNGHGLGLSIVRAIAQAHGATITAIPRSEGGLDVEVTFTSVKVDVITRIDRRTGVENVSNVFGR
jgi:signal transduction histidine kinase